jgi:hypothetical protein
MLEYKKRMPRYNKIPKITATNRDIEKLSIESFRNDDISVTRLRYAKLDFKNIDEIAIDVMQRKLPDDSRTKEIMESVSRIEASEEYDELFSFLSSRTGADAFSPLIRKLRSKKDTLYADVLSKLADGYNDIFMDHAVLILGYEFSHRDISDDIVRTLISDKVRDPQDYSSLLMLIGKSCDSRHIDFLYSLYIFFRDNFPEDEYFEGPLLAIKDIADAHV